jgi:predicted DNA-binding protein
MVRAWVKISLHQYDKLKKLRETARKTLSKIIREAVCEFVKKKDFPVSTAASHLAKRTRDKYKAVSAYFPRSDWDLLEEISKNTERCKTELIRQAVDEYLERRA